MYPVFWPYHTTAWPNVCIIQEADCPLIRIQEVEVNTNRQPPHERHRSKCAPAGLKFPNHLFNLACMQVSGRRWGVTFPLQERQLKVKAEACCCVSCTTAWDRYAGTDISRKTDFGEVIRGLFLIKLSTPPVECLICLFSHWQAYCCCFSSWHTHLYKALHFNESEMYPFKYSHYIF